MFESALRCFALVIVGSSLGCAAETQSASGSFTATLTRTTTAGCPAAETTHKAASVDISDDGGGKLTVTFRAGSEVCTLDGHVDDGGVASLASTKSCAIYPAAVQGMSGGVYSWTVPSPNIELHHALPGKGTGDASCFAKDVWQLTRN